MHARVRFHAPRIVQPGHHRTRWIRAVLLLLLLAGAAGLGWRLGCRGEIAALQHVRHDLERVQERSALQEREQQALRQEMAELRQLRGMDGESLVALKEQIRQCQEERIQLNQELKLMRGVLSKDETPSALQVQDFGVQKLATEHRYVVAFTVRQLNKEFGVAKGSIRFTIAGEEGERKQQLALSEMVADESTRLKMRFRYFQKVEQEIRLPSGFVPQSVTVEVNPDNQELSAISQVFSWPPES